MSDGDAVRLFFFERGVDDDRAGVAKTLHDLIVGEAGIDELAGRPQIEDERVDMIFLFSRDSVAAANSAKIDSTSLRVIRRRHGCDEIAIGGRIQQKALAPAVASLRSSAP